MRPSAATIEVELRAQTGRYGGVMASPTHDSGDPKTEPNDEASPPAEEEEGSDDWGDQPTVQMPAIPMPED